jgi:hypothetical protein
VGPLLQQHSCYLQQNKCVDDDGHDIKYNDDGSVEERLNDGNPDDGDNGNPNDNNNGNP